MADKENKAKIEETQIVIFKLAKEEFGVDISEVKEIIKMEEIIAIPNTEEHIKGIINLREKIIVVVSLAKKLNLPVKQYDKDTRIIIIEKDTNVVGMIVDSVEEVLRFSADRISPAPQMIKNELDSKYLQGVCVIGQRLIVLLDLTMLISAKDIDSIAKISEEHKSA